MERVPAGQQDASNVLASSNQAPAIKPLSSARVRLLDLQSEWENAGERDQELAFSSPLWARLALPHSNPGDVPEWVATNGDLTLSVQPGIRFNVQGQRVSAGFPFGIIPRHLMVYVATEATRTKSPHIALGDSFHAFIRKLGLRDGSVTRQRMADQLYATSAAKITVTQLATTGTGWGVRAQNLNVFDHLDLWLNGRGALAKEPGLWGSSIELTPGFYESIVNDPMPVYAADLRALGGSSLRHDIYLWLVYRLHVLPRRTRVSWKQLHDQFGSNYKLERQFKSKFTDALRDVLVLYPEARVRPHKNFLVLDPSPAHIEPSKRR